MESYFSKKIILLHYSGVEIAVSMGKMLQLRSQLKQSLKADEQEILDAIITTNVYVSVDKDCLRVEDAIANWGGQGTLPLETVTTCIEPISEQYIIVGADKVGDYSPPVFTSIFKWIDSILDRASNTWRLKSGVRANTINSMANVKIAYALGFM